MLETVNLDCRVFKLGKLSIGKDTRESREKRFRIFIDHAFWNFEYIRSSLLDFYPILYTIPNCLCFQSSFGPNNTQVTLCHRVKSA